LPLLEKDVQWLINAADPNGAYTYTSADGKPLNSYDNSNAQMATLGVWAGSRRGVKVPKKYWSLIERYWTDQQQGDGGWNYRASSPGASYGSMTAAGIATLFICFDELHSRDYIRANSTPAYKPLTDGLKWLGDNYSISENPVKKNRYYLYYMYSLERVGLTSGYKYFDGHDWYAEGVAELLKRQRPDGSWSENHGQTVDTAFVLLFLARGRNPVLVNKLQYTGRWNTRPREMANFTRWVSSSFERTVNWQIIDVDAPVHQWHDAPILYISGAGA
ncbi:unnamed protein product, partial [marine sediment metagenome]